MEVLLAALTELMIGTIFLAGTLVAELVGVLLNLLFPFFSNRFVDARDLRQREQVRAEPARATPSPFSEAAVTLEPPAPRRPGKAHRMIRNGLFALLGASVLGLLVAQFFFVDDLIRFALNRAEERTGIQFEIDSADGNLFTGSATIRNMRAKRLEHESSKFELAIATTELDIGLLGLLQGDVSFDSVRVDGVRGWYRRTAASTDKPPRRAFTIDSLVAENVQLLITDETRDPALVDLPLVIDRSTTTPLRSHWAAYDVLFRTNATGSLDGRPLEITSARDGRDYQFRWDASRLPVRLLSSIFGKFWGAFEDGGAVVVIDGMTSGDAITLSVTLAADDLKLRTKDDAGWLSRKMTAALQKRLEKHEGKLKLAVAFTMDRDLFEGAISPIGIAIWKELADAVSNRMDEMLGAAKKKGRELGKRALKSILSPDKKQAPKKTDERHAPE